MNKDEEDAWLFLLGLALTIALGTGGVIWFMVWALSK